jgi:hypothetical protein
MRKLVAIVFTVVVLFVLWRTFYEPGGPEGLMYGPNRQGPVADSVGSELDPFAGESTRSSVEPEDPDEDPVPALPAPKMHRFKFTVQVQDSSGRPYSGVEIQVAPPNHPFMTLGTTDGGGFAAVEFGAVANTLVVDLAFVDGSYDLSGFHKLRLFGKKPRAIHVSVPRRDYVMNYVDMTASVAAARTHGVIEEKLKLMGLERRKTRSRFPLRPGRYAGSALSGTNIFGTAKLAGGVDSGADSHQVQLAALREEIENERAVLSKRMKGEDVGIIRGKVIDHMGEPVSGYPVWAEYSGPRRVEEFSAVTRQDGSFYLSVFAGEVRCYAGQNAGVLIKDFRIAEGETLHWNPIVSLADEVQLSLPQEIADSGAYQIQANVDDGRVLAITRRLFQRSGSVRFPVSSTLPTSLHLLFVDGQSVYPIHHIGFFSAGEETVLDIADCTPRLSTATIPAFQVPGVSPAFFPEALVLLSGEDWGYRTGLNPEGNELAGFRMPIGNWRIDLSFDALGRRSLGPVSVESTSSFALPSYVVPKAGLLKLDSASHGPRFVTVTQLREDILTRAYESEHVFEAGQGLSVTVSPGEYRVEVAGEDGPQYTGVVTIFAGQTASVDV